MPCQDDPQKCPILRDYVTMFWVINLKRFLKDIKSPFLPMGAFGDRKREFGVYPREFIRRQSDIVRDLLPTRLMKKLAVV
mmetsp:Transcript_26218/g.75629  ORF Transcript_26218/g.75629 Transcript_26218/m.75629 type:complete len:80 (-) Transcript_26218:680-919(-)